MDTILIGNDAIDGEIMKGENNIHIGFKRKENFHYSYKRMLNRSDFNVPSELDMNYIYLMMKKCITLNNQDNYYILNVQNNKIKIYFFVSYDTNNYNRINRLLNGIKKYFKIKHGKYRKLYFTVTISKSSQEEEYGDKYEVLKTMIEIKKILTPQHRSLTKTFPIVT